MTITLALPLKLLSAYSVYEVCFKVMKKQEETLVLLLL